MQKMKTKCSKETVRAVLTLIRKKIDTKISGSTIKQNLLDSLKNFAKLENKKVYPTMSETKVFSLNLQNDP